MGLLSPLAAHAHGEAAILVFVAFVAAISGLLAGAMSGTVSVLAKSVWPQWFLAYLAVGCLVAGVAAQGIEGSTLFLAFGGIGGILPFVLAYYASRPAAKWFVATVRRARKGRDA